MGSKHRRLCAAIGSSILLLIIVLSFYGFDLAHGLTIAAYLANKPGIDRFRAAFPHINVTHNSDLNGNSDFTFKTIQSMMGRRDNSIDVFMIDVIWVGELADHFIDLNQYITEDEKKKYYPALIENNTVEKKLVALPWYFTAGLLYYRQDLLTKYGYAGPPKTWDELEEMAAKIQEGERAAGADDFWGWTWHGYPAEGLTCFGLELLGGSGGGTIIDQDVNGELKITVDNPKALAMLERTKKWIGTISTHAVVKSKEKEAEALWYAGNTAFLRGWPGVVGNSYSNPFLSTRFGVAPLPGIVQGSGKGSIGGWNLAVNRYSRNIDDAVKLVKFLTSPPEIKFTALNMTRLPPMKEIMTDPDICSTTRTKFMCENEWSNTLVARPATISTPNYNTASQMFYVTINAALSGKMKPDQALKVLARDLNDLFELKDSSLVRSFTAKIWTWFGPSLSVLILIIVVVFCLYVILPIISRKRFRGQVHNKEKLTERLVNDGSVTSADDVFSSMRPSIRSIIILLFIVLIVITSLSAWLLSWSNGRQSAQEIGAQLRNSILQRVKESAENSILTARALGRGGSLTIDYASSVIATFVPTVLATPGTRIVVIDRQNGTVIATTGVKTKRSLPLIESKDKVVRDAARHVLKQFGSYQRVEFQEGNPLFVSDKEKVYIDGVSVYDPSGIAWIVLIMIPEYDIMGKIHRGTLITLIVSMGVIMVSVFFSLLFSFVITKPLSTLVKQMEKVTEMDLDSAGQITSSMFSEVYSIQVVFKRMVEMMREYKSYMPSSLFVEEGDEEDEGRQSIDTSRILGSVSEMATPIFSPGVNVTPSIGTSGASSSTSQSSKQAGTHANRKATRIELVPKQYTVIIINIEDFNMLLEVLSVKDVIKIHSDYVESLTRIIALHRGSYDRFVADKIIGSFNTALACASHVENACRCALACQDKISKLQKAWSKLGFPHIKIRIGIACGAGYCGNMGSASVRAYSVVGPTVNLASSLEQLNKDYYTKILMDDKTFDTVKSKIVARSVDVVQMSKLNKNNTTVRIYELIQMRNIKGDEWMYEMQESEKYNQVFNNYEEGFQAFINQDFERCIQFMKQQLQETPKDIQTERILALAQEYQLRPPDRFFVKRVD